MLQLGLVHGNNSLVFMHRTLCMHLQILHMREITKCARKHKQVRYTGGAATLWCFLWSKTPLVEDVKHSVHSA